MDLSVLIPARNERWLARTVADVLEHAKADTEVIVVLDGAWPEEPVPQHPRVQMVYLPESIGQRAATNLAAKLSSACYVMKLDAHCSVADGFDMELIRAGELLGPDVTQIPAQRNLNIYNRVCPCGKREYQGNPEHPCVLCGQTEWTLEIVWQPRGGTTTKQWSFTSEPRFQYNGVPEQPSEDGIHDVMSSLGACFFMRRDRYEQIGGLDERHGSWGNVGVEVAAKSWLSGGRHVCCTQTWFAHFFRVGGIGFPYEIHGSDQDKARKYSHDLWYGNLWPGQVRPLSWLVEKFWPVNGWTDAERASVAEAGRRFAIRGVDVAQSVSEQPVESKAPAIVAKAPRKAIVYYSDCRPDPRILQACQRTIERSGLPIIAVTLKPIDWPAATNIVLPLERGYLTMFRQILIGLALTPADVVFFAEHDVAYHESHWDFMPTRDDCYFYNDHCWKVNAETGHAITYQTKQTSQICADRRLLVRHYRTRLDRVERDGFSRRMGFEPGSHRRPERVDDIPAETWRSAVPNIDIRHGHNLTASRWHPSQFRDQRNCQGWQEADAIPGWGQTGGRFWDFLQEHTGDEMLMAGVA